MIALRQMLNNSQANQVKRTPGHRSLLKKIRPAACWLLALLVFFPARIAVAALDNELQPLPPESVLTGRLGAVGMVIAGRGESLSMASGFLVSPCHVLTAAHVLARVGEKVQLGTSARFVPEGGKNAAIAERSVWGKVVAASPDFIMTATPGRFDMQTIAQDWGLIELDRPVADIAPIKLLFSGSKIASTARLAIVGYPAGAPGHLLHAHEHCRNWSSFHGAEELPGVVIADCAVRAGMSGGPMFLEGGLQPVAAGIVVERFEIGTKIMAVGVSIAAFADSIDAAMRASEVCAVGSPFVWPPATGDTQQNY